MSMQIRMTAANPDKIEFRMNITMSLKDWREIRKELANSHRDPIWEFRNKIDKVITLAEKDFEAYIDD